MISWNNLHVDRNNNSDNYGIISKEEPPKIILKDNYILETDNTISNEDLIFINKNNKNGEDNNTLSIDQSLNILSNGGIFHLKFNNDIIGFIISFPHKIKLDNIVENTVLTTYLCINKEYRKNNFAMIMIQKAILDSYNKNIYCGYHYIEKSQSDSNIQIKTWYRPLNIETSELNGYEIPIPKLNYDIKKVKKITYALDSKERIRLANFEDLKKVLIESNRFLTINIPTSEEWDRLDSKSFNWVICSQGGIMCYRDFKIIEYKENFKVCQIVFYEINGDEESKIKSFRGMLTYLKKIGYDVVHGLVMGPLNGIEDRCRLIRSDVLYLDFYNFKIHKLESSQVNLLYI